MLGVLVIRGRGAEHDVPARGEHPCRCAYKRDKIHCHRLACLVITNAVVEHVLLVARVPLDIGLCGQQFATVDPDLCVNVRRAARVGNGLDGAEEILAAAGRENATVALESGLIIAL